MDLVNQVLTHTEQFIEKQLLSVLDWPTLDKIMSYWLCRTRDRSYIDFLPSFSCMAVGGDLDLATPVTAFWILSLLGARIFDDLQDKEVSHDIWHQNEVAIPAGISLLSLSHFCLAHITDVTALKNIISMTATAEALAAKAQHIQKFDTISAYLEFRVASTAMVYATIAWAGARLATEDEALLNTIRQFAHNIGMRDAIRSDCQDLLVGKDLVRGKYTLPVLYGLSLNQHPYHTMLTNLVKPGICAQENDIHDILTILKDMGVITWSLAKANIYHNKAVALLDAFPVPENQKLGVSIYVAEKT